MIVLVINFKSIQEIQVLNHAVQSFLDSSKDNGLVEKAKLEALEIKFMIIQETLLEVNNPLEDPYFREFVETYFKAFQELKSSISPETSVITLNFDS